MGLNYEILHLYNNYYYKMTSKGCSLKDNCSHSVQKCGHLEIPFKILAFNLISSIS